VADKGQIKVLMNTFKHKDVFEAVMKNLPNMPTHSLKHSVIDLLGELETFSLLFALAFGEFLGSECKLFLEKKEMNQSEIHAFEKLSALALKVCRQKDASKEHFESLALPLVQFCQLMPLPGIYRQ